MNALFNHDAWDVAALFDASGNVVQWNTLIAADTGFEQELITQETTNGEYQSGTHDTMKLACPDYAGQEQLEAWKRNNTPVRAVALSTQAGGRNCRWTEYTPLQSLLDNAQGKRSEGDSYLKAVLDGYDAAWRYQNLIYKFNSTDLKLPLAGLTLTLSGHRSDANSFNLGMEITSYAGLILGSVDQNLPPGGDRGAVEIVLPSDTWEIEFFLDGATDAALRVDGGTEYIAG